MPVDSTPLNSGKGGMSYGGAGGNSDNFVEVKDPGCCGKSKAFAKSSLGHDASVQDEVPLGPHSDQFKQCHDCPCIGFFGLYWVGMFIIVAMAFQYGDVYRLFYATDYQGATCGVGSLEGFNYGYYPTLADDVLKAVTDNSCDLAGGSCTLSLFTVCVDSSSGRCPSAGDVVCTYAKQAEITAVAKEDDAVRKQLQYKYAANHDNCWFVAVNMTQKFYRCVPWPDASESIVTDVCQEYNANGQLVTVSKSKSECAGAVTETKTSVSMTTGGADELLFTVASYTYYVQELFADLVEVWWVVALVGAGLSVVSSFTFILMLSYVAGCMVWLIIIAIWIAIGFCASFLFLKGGSFFTIDLTGITATASNALTSSDSESVARLAAITGVSQNYAVYYEIAGYVLFFFFASYFCLVCCLSKQIQLCIAIMKSSGNFIGHMKAVPFFPLVIYVAQMALLSFCIIMVCLIESIKDLTTADLASAVAASTNCLTSANQTNCVASLLAMNSTMNGNHTLAGDVVTSYSMRNPMHVYNLFGFFWTVNTMQAVGMVTIATAIASQYWSPLDPTTGKPKKVDYAVTTAFKSTMTYHYGSCIFGAFVIALVQLVRAILQYINYQTQQLQKEQKWVKYLMMGLQCCLWCFEKVVKYLTRNAYIFMSIEGTNFCTSACRSFMMLMSNLGRIGVVQVISHFVVMLGKLSITAFCVIVGYLSLTYGECFQAGGAYKIGSPLVPCIAIGILSFVVSFAFMETYGITTDVLIFSYILDEKYFNEKKTHQMFAESYDIPAIAQDHTQEDDEGTEKSSPPREEVE